MGSAPSTIKDVGVMVVAQPGVWAELLEDGIQLRPGFEEWWNRLLLAGNWYPYHLVFNHTIDPGLTDDQDITLDSDMHLISVQGTSSLNPEQGLTPSYRTQFYEVVDGETGLSHMRLGINDSGLVGTGTQQAFFPHPYKMTAGQVLLCRTLNLSDEPNKVQIAIYGVKRWKLDA